MGTILLGSPRQKFIWKDDGKVYLDRFSVSNVWDAAFAPNGSYLAVSNAYGDDASLSLVKFNMDEGVTSVQAVNKHRDAYIDDMAFSTDSSKVLSADYSGVVLVYDIDDGSKYQLALTEEDCFNDVNSRPIGKAVFLDEDRIAIGTNTGMFIVWEPETDSIEKYSPTQKKITDIHVLSDDEVIFTTRDSITRFTISTEKVAPVVALEGIGFTKLFVQENLLLRIIMLNNNRLQLDSWNTESFSKNDSEVLSLDFDEDSSIYLWETNDGQPVLGFDVYNTEVNPLILLDPSSLKKVDSNNENGSISARFSPVYINALDQYIGVGLSRYELVLAGGDDPLFKEPIARMSTLRKIRSFTVSPDGTMAYALTDGMIQAFGLVDPEESYSIMDDDLSSYHGIDAVNNENLLLTFVSNRRTSLGILNLASEEISQVNLPTKDGMELNYISRGEEYPEGVYAFSFENWGVLIYDTINRRTLKKIQITNDPSNLYWRYQFFPDDNQIIGLADGYYKFLKTDINF